MLAVPTPQLAIPYRGFRSTGAMAARDGYVFQSAPREDVSTAGLSSTSGTLYMQLCRVLAGDTVTSLSVFFVGANNTPTAWYFALYNASRVLLAQTADQTSTAISANSLVTINLASPVSFTSDQNVYVGLCQVATGPATPARLGVAALPMSTNTNLVGVAPILLGTSDTGLSNGTAPATAAAITASAAAIWCAGA